MVKTPKTRHSKHRRDPLTIELEPGAVSRVETPAEEAVAEEPVAAADMPVSEPVAGVASEPVAEAPSEPIEPEPAAAPAEPASAAGADMSAGRRTEEPARFKTASDYDFSEDPRVAPKPAPNPEPARATEPSPATPSKRSGTSALAAGLIGGVVALAGGGLLQFAGLIGAPGAGGTGQIVSLDGVNAEIAALKTEIETLKAAPPSDAGARVDALGQALEAVKADVAGLREAVTAGDAPALAALTERLAALESTVAGLGQNQAGIPAEQLAALTERIAGLEALVKAAGEAGSAVDGRIGALEQSIAALTAKVDAQAAQPKIALAIASSALKSAIERGVPFVAELETFAAIAPDAAQIAALRPFAEKGVVTRAAIVAEVDVAANAMIAAADPIDDDAGFFQRLLESAESLVKVRPIGAVEGQGVPETVARMEVALKAGDFAKALAEYDTLPEPAKQAGAALADTVRARMEVERLVDEAVTAAMQA